MSRKLKYALASIAAAIVPGIAAPGARAINNPPDEAGNCVIQGTMHTSGVGVLANSGTYSFDSFIDNCTETDSTDASETNPDVSINLTSTGSFNNSVCGTSGEAGCAWNGTATVFGSTDPSEFPVGTTFSYTIDFVGGEGAFFSGGTAPNQAGDSTIVGVNGSVSLVPDPGPGYPNSQYYTDNFQAAGDLVFVLRDANPGM